LLAFEAANGDITFNYIFVFKDGKAVAFAYTQIITISIKTITKNTRMLKRIRQGINTLFRQHPLRVLFCGNIFLSGEYGIFLQDGENKTDAFKVIAKALKQLSKKTKKLHALFVKDFEENSLKITNQLYDFDYASMTVEPNMIINLKPE
jgi:siroheme synthase (precorrin-2 oxidase/ferrochelatase)